MVRFFTLLVFAVLFCFSFSVFADDSDNEFNLGLPDDWGLNLPEDFASEKSSSENSLPANVRTVDDFKLRLQGQAQIGQNGKYLFDDLWPLPHGQGNKNFHFGKITGTDPSEAMASLELLYSCGDRA